MSTVCCRHRYTTWVGGCALYVCQYTGRLVQWACAFSTEPPWNAPFASWPCAFAWLAQAESQKRVTTAQAYALLAAALHLITGDPPESFDHLQEHHQEFFNIAFEIATRDLAKVPVAPSQYTLCRFGGDLFDHEWARSFDEHMHIRADAGYTRVCGCGVPAPVVPPAVRWRRQPPGAPTRPQLVPWSLESLPTGRYIGAKITADTIELECMPRRLCAPELLCLSRNETVVRRFYAALGAAGPDSNPTAGKNKRKRQHDKAEKKKGGRGGSSGGRRRAGGGGGGGGRRRTREAPASTARTVRDLIGSSTTPCSVSGDGGDGGGSGSGSDTGSGSNSGSGAR